MLRIRMLIVSLLLLGLTGGVFGQAENERAKSAAEVYQKAVDEARQAYIKELELAIKEAGGAGDLEEANRLAENKAALEKEGKVDENDPVALATKQLENSKWVTPGKGKGFIRFLPGNKTTNHMAVAGVWIMTDKQTALTQNGKGGDIHVFQFDEKLKQAVVHRFENANVPKTYVKR